MEIVNMKFMIVFIFEEGGREGIEMGRDVRYGWFYLYL